MTHTALLYLQGIAQSQATSDLPVDARIFDEGIESALHRELFELHLIEKLLGTPSGGFGWRLTSSGIVMGNERGAAVPAIAS